MLSFACIVPHPPIIIPEIGGEEILPAEKTINALLRLSLLFAASRADTVLLISPHAVILHDRIAVGYGSLGKGTFGTLGYPDLSQSYAYDSSLVTEITHSAFHKKIQTDSYVTEKQENSVELDHGALVPLYYFSKAYPQPFQVTLSSISDFSSIKHFHYGEALREAIEKSEKRIAVVVSADLSHRLSAETPYGFHASGEIFDRTLRELIKSKNSEKIVHMDKQLVDEAAACGYQPIVTLMGLLNNTSFEPDIISYEAPWGIGYVVANMKLGGTA